MSFSISGPFRTCAYLPSLVIAFTAFAFRPFSTFFNFFFSFLALLLLLLFCSPLTLVLSLCFLKLPVLSVFRFLFFLFFTCTYLKMRSLLVLRFQYLRSISIKMHKVPLGRWFSIATVVATAVKACLYQSRSSFSQQASA